VEFGGSGSGTSRLRIALDCEDSERSRGLLLISALHIAAPRLRSFGLVACNALTPPVRAAIEYLVWETGLDVQVSHAPLADVVADAGLLVAVAVEDTSHLPLASARQRRIPCIAPVQFPRAGAPFGASVLARAAHDPAALAARMVEALAP